MDNKYYDYITGTGVIVPDTSNLLSEIQKRFTDLFGENLDLSPTTPQGRLIELFNRSETFTLQACAMMSNMLNLNKANGFVLDDLGALFLIERKPATRTQTTVIMYGVPDTIIPANTRLRSSDGYVFVNPSPATIGADGSVGVLYVAEQAGEIPAVADTITLVLDGVNGLERVVNPAPPSQIGQLQESDNVFRNRIKASLNLNAIGVLSAIKAGIEQVSGVVGSYCYDNFDDVAVIIDGLSVPAHSLLAVVDGGDEQEIANVLYAKKTAGAGYVDKYIVGSSGRYNYKETSNDYVVWERSGVLYYTNKNIIDGGGVYSDNNLETLVDTITAVNNVDFDIVEKTVIDEAYGVGYKVRFVRPILSDVDVYVKVARKTYSGENLEEAVKSAIMTFARGDNPEVDGIVIGGSVSPFEIASAVSSELPDVFITSVEVGLHGAEKKSETLTFGAIHKANILPENITVEITEQ